MLKRIGIILLAVIIVGAGLRAIQGLRAAETEEQLGPVARLLRLFAGDEDGNDQADSSETPTDETAEGDRPDVGITPAGGSTPGEPGAAEEAGSSADPAPSPPASPPPQEDDDVRIMW
jgi:hypothetical protein